MRVFRRFLAVILAISFSLTFFIFYGCAGSNEGITKYDIECSYKDQCLYATEKVSFFNHSDNAFDKIKFNLFGNAFRQGAKYSPVATQYLVQSYPNGINYGNMKINEVQVENKPAKFEIAGDDQNILVVYLSDSVYPQERVNIKIDFTLQLAKVIARTGINDKTINLGNFYPIVCGIYNQSFYECNYYSTGDPFFSDCADYQVKLLADKKYKVATSGKLVNKKSQGDDMEYTYSLKSARSFAMVLSEFFNILTLNQNGIEVNYYYYNDQDANKSIQTVIKALKLYSEKFGAYPYLQYSVVQTKFVQGGMEYPALAMISDSLESAPYQEVIAHETAHQWWQTTVGNNEVEFAFLDEGLCEYSVVLFYENYSEYGFKREELIESARKTYKAFCSVYDKLFHNVNTTMVRPLDQFSSEYEYVNIAYIKPCIMFDILRQTIGEDRFFKGLKRYYKENAFQNATPSHLEGAFERVGADTNGFFESFFNGKVIL